MTQRDHIYSLGEKNSTQNISMAQDYVGKILSQENAIVYGPVGVVDGIFFSAFLSGRILVSVQDHLESCESVVIR